MAEVEPTSVVKTVIGDNQDGTSFATYCVVCSVCSVTSEYGLYGTEEGSLQCTNPEDSETTFSIDYLFSQ